MNITVIITAYNNEQYLADTIDSVLAQTLLPVEILVTDDCSTDSSPDIIRRYEAARPGLVRGLFQPRNQFIARNRNAALAEAKGEYVTILDGDDIYLPTNLEKLAAAISAAPKADIAYSNVYYIDPDGERFRVRDDKQRPTGDLFAYIASLQFGLLRSMLIRTDLIRQVGGFNPEFPHHDGYILSLELAKLTEYAYVFEPTAEYRVHPQSNSKMPFRNRLHFNEQVAREVLRQTADLPAGQRSHIAARWDWKLRHLRILRAEQEQGRLAALRETANGLRQKPRHSNESLAVIRGLLKR